MFASWSVHSGINLLRSFPNVICALIKFFLSIKTIEFFVTISKFCSNMKKIFLSYVVVGVYFGTVFAVSLLIALF